MVPLYRLQGHIFLSQLLYSEEIRQTTPFLQSVPSTLSPTHTIHFTGTFFVGEGNSLIITGVEHLSISFWIFRSFHCGSPIHIHQFSPGLFDFSLLVCKSVHILDPDCVSGTGTADISARSAACLLTWLECAVVFARFNFNIVKFSLYDLWVFLFYVRTLSLYKNILLCSF